MSRPATPGRAAWENLIQRTRFIPVVTIERVADAVPLARALLAGGLPVVEVTLRTPGALEAIAHIARDAPEVVVGAGTIVSKEQIALACSAGARFLVSPGTTPDLAAALAGAAVPVMPGGASVSEAMALAAHGFSVQKFFPAEASGGTIFLKNIAPVLPNLAFCPTGGLDAGNFTSYLALANVMTTGGAWVAPARLVAAGDFAAITALARTAAA